MLVIDRIKALKFILLGALINSSLFIGFEPQGFSLLRIFIVLFLFASVLLLFIFSIKQEKLQNISQINIYFKVMLILLFFWSGFTIFRDLSLNVKDMIALFGHYLMGWAWITPLAIVFGFNIYNWVSIFDFLGKLLLVGVILTFFILFFPGVEESYTFGIVEWVQFFPILLFTYWYQKPFYKKVTILAVVAFIILSIYNSQRVSALYLGLVVIFMLIEMIRTKHIGGYKKIFILLSLALLLLILVMKIPAFYNNLKQDKHVTTDTRTFLLIEMFHDMSQEEQIIGRGALGTYYSPYFSMLRHQGFKDGDSPIRSVNEIGYLEMILKGGYIMMILYLLILVPAAYLGIFRSKNSIARMSGYIIAIYLVVWLVSYYSVYSAEYLLLWMAVGTVISPYSRNISEDQIKKFINKDRC